jgi:SnoaL-like domain
MAVPVDVRLDIQELTNLYALYVDTRQSAKVVDLFVEDGVMDEVQIGLPRASGRDQLRAYFFESPKEVTHMIHYICNHVISDYQDDEAKGVCFFLCEARLVNGKHIRIQGYYDDRYVRHDGRWRFRSRRVVPVLPPEMDDLFDLIRAR